MGISVGKRMGPMTYAALLAMLSLAGGCAKTQEPRGDDGERELELARAQNTALHKRLKEIATYEAELERAESTASQTSELAASEWSVEPGELSLCERPRYAARPVAGDSALFASLSVGGFSHALPSFGLQRNHRKWTLEWDCGRDEPSSALDLLRKDWKRENARLALGDFASDLQWQDMGAQADAMSLVVRLNRRP